MKRIKQDDELPEPPVQLLCPLSQQLFIDPVIASDGHTYERQSILKWFRQSNRSPITRQLLNINILIPNRLARSQVQNCLKNTRDSTYKWRIFLTLAKNQSFRLAIQQIRRAKQNRRYENLLLQQTAKIIFDTPQSILALNKQLLLVGTQFGLWQYYQGKKTLINNRIDVQALALLPPDRQVIGSDCIKQALFLLNEDNSITQLDHLKFQGSCDSIWARADGMILYCSWEQNCIMIADLCWDQSQIFLDQQHGPICNPAGVCEVSKLVLVANFGTNTVVLFNKDRTINRIVKQIGKPFLNLRGAAIKGNTAFVCDRGNKRIVCFWVNARGLFNKKQLSIKMQVKVKVKEQIKEKQLLEEIQKLLAQEQLLQEDEVLPFQEIEQQSQVEEEFQYEEVDLCPLSCEWAGKKLFVADVANDRLICLQQIA